LFIIFVIVLQTTFLSALPHCANARWNRWHKDLKQLLPWRTGGYFPLCYMLLYAGLLSRLIRHVWML